jgi:hypothetical protein
MKFRLLIKGANFLVALDSKTPGKHAFFVTAHLEAPSEAVAEKQAFELLRNRDGLRELVLNTADDRPTLHVEKVGAIETWPAGVSRPLTGLAWYEEEGAEPGGTDNSGELRSPPCLT